MITRKHMGHFFKVMQIRIDHHMNLRLQELDLTSSQGRIIGFIARQTEAPCCRDLEEAFQLSHPSVSGTLSRLEKKGFLESRPDPEDRRLKRLYLLPKGEECHNQIHATIQAIEEQIIQDFSPEEAELFSQLLSRAMANMGCIPPPPKPKEES